MEDALVPVGFVILDMQQTNVNSSHTAVILERPFLATSKALINCKSGVLNFFDRIINHDDNTNLEYLDACAEFSSPCEV